MASETRTGDLDPAAILRSAGWPEPLGSSPVTGGWDTEIWQVQTPDRGRHALRVYRAGPWAERAAQREVAALRAVAAVGLPAPVVEAAGEYDGRWYLILSWLDGRPLSNVLGSRPWEVWRLGISFGRLQARLHAVSPPAELASTDPAAWIAVIEDDVIAAAVRAAAGPAVLCHGDYHPLNVLAAPPRLTGLIDFMNVMAADRRADLGITQSILLHAPLPPDPLRPVLQIARRIFAQAWRRGYRSRAGGFPLDPLFEAWGAAYYVRGLESAVRDGRGWATEEDVRSLRRLIADRTRAAGIG